MECSCAIEVDHDCGPEFYNITMPVARKKHVCCECLKDILPGEQYERIDGKWDGIGMESYKTCMDCKSLRDVFFDTWIYTQVWEDFYNEYGYTDSIIPEHCISQLTPKVRAIVCEYIEEKWDED